MVACFWLLYTYIYIYILVTNYTVQKHDSSSTRDGVVAIINTDVTAASIWWFHGTGRDGQNVRRSSSSSSSSWSPVKYEWYYMVLHRQVLCACSIQKKTETNHHPVVYCCCCCCCLYPRTKIIMTDDTTTTTTATATMTMTMTYRSVLFCPFLSFWCPRVRRDNC